MKLNKTYTAEVRRRWDSIQAKGNNVDFERGQLLHEVWSNVLDRNDKTLGDFIITELGEFPGKSTSALVRLAHAFDAVKDQDTWRMIGGQSAVLLARIGHTATRRKVLRKVLETTSRTGRDVVSRATFRTLLVESLGQEGYQGLLIERKAKNAANVRAQLDACKQCLLRLVRTHPEIKKEIPASVKKMIGLGRAKVLEHASAS